MTLRTDPPFRADHVGSLLRPPALLDARAPARRRRARRRRAARRSRTTVDPRGGRPAARRRAAHRDRRRVPPHVVAHGLHLPARAASTAPTRRSQVHFRNADGDLDFESAGAARRRAGLAAATRSSATRSRSSPRRSGRPPTADRQADHPVAEHGALPRRPGRDRRARLPRPRAVLDRPLRGVRRAAAPGRRPGLHLPPARRHQPGLPERPAAAARCVAEQGADAEHQHEQYIRTINAAIADRPAGLHVTTHMCRGNYRSSWAAEGGYDFVAEALFCELAVDGFFLEYDDERSGGFEPLRFVPDGQAGRARPGHHQDAARSRTRTPSSAGSTRPRSTCRSTSSASPRSAASPPPSRATRSPCDEQLAKLRLVVETAEEVWG